MTDIPGTILTAIRDAIDAAVLTERTRCAKIAEAYYCSDSDRMSGDAVAIDARARIAAKIREHAVPYLTMEQCDILTREFGDGWLAADFPQRDDVRARVAQMVKESAGWASDPPTETSCISVIAKLRAESEAEPFRCPACGQGQNYAAESVELIELTPDWHAISKAYIQPAVDALDDMMQQSVVDYVNCLPLSLKNPDGR